MGCVHPCRKPRGEDGLKDPPKDFGLAPGDAPPAEVEEEDGEKGGDAEEGITLEDEAQEAERERKRRMRRQADAILRTDMVLENDGLWTLWGWREGRDGKLSPRARACWGDKQRFPRAPHSKGLTDGRAAPLPSARDDCKTSSCSSASSEGDSSTL